MRVSNYSFRLFFLTCLIGIFSTLNANAEKDQSTCIFQLLNRLSGKTDHQYHIESIHPVSRLSETERHLLNPDIEVTTEAGGHMNMGLRNFTDFEKTTKTLQKKGFFTFFFPSGEGSRTAAGHMSILIDGSFFDRNLDSQGANAIRSMNQEEFSKLFEHIPYAVAQFYELSEKSVAELSHYFHERTWHYHANTVGFHTSYVPLPFNDHRPLSEIENCNTFAFSFMEPDWQKRYPELRHIQTEFGNLELSQAPSKQLLNNTHSVAYRGSLFISDQEKFKSGLLSDGLRNDFSGSQLLLAAPAQLLHE